MHIRVGPDACPSPHSWKNKLARVIWCGAWLFLFRTSPWFCYGWRRLILRLFGARVGVGAKVFPSTRIWAPWRLEMGNYACLSHDVDCYCVAPVYIGDHATVSQYSFLCTATHDVLDPNMRLISSPIVIEDQAWICAKAYLAPGVTVGQGAVAGACSVVTKSIPAWTIACGNPARPLRTRRLSSSDMVLSAEGELA